MLTLKHIIKSMKFSQSLGIHPCAPICTERLSTDDINKYYPPRYSSIQLPYQSQQQEKYRIRPDQEFEFHFPSSKRKHLFVKGVQALTDDLQDQGIRRGRIIPRYWPIDKKTQKPYEDIPF